jgi:hypothetical protein
MVSQSSVHIREVDGLIDVDVYLDGELRTHTFYGIKTVDVIVFRDNVQIGSAFYHVVCQKKNSCNFGVKYFKKFVLRSAKKGIKESEVLTVILEEI